MIAFVGLKRDYWAEQSYYAKKQLTVIGIHTPETEGESRIEQVRKVGVGFDP